MQFKCAISQPVIQRSCVDGDKSDMQDSVEEVEGKGQHGGRFVTVSVHVSLSSLSLSFLPSILIKVNKIALYSPQFVKRVIVFDDNHLECVTLVFVCLF